MNQKLNPNGVPLDGLIAAQKADDEIMAMLEGRGWRRLPWTRIWLPPKTFMVADIAMFNQRYGQSGPEPEPELQDTIRRWGKVKLTSVDFSEIEKRIAKRFL